MLRSIRKIRGFKALCTDGEVGTVSDLYFDDEKWGVRYLVVEAGTWLTRRPVLISPHSIREVTWDTGQIRLKIDREKVQKSPDIDCHRPISRQREAVYHSYYGYPYYWTDPSVWAGSPIPTFARPVRPGPPAPGAKSEKPRPEGPDSHLRSAGEVLGYRVLASDGEIGHVQDLLLDEENWVVDSVAVEGPDLPGEIRYPLRASSVSQISWLDATFCLSLSGDEVRAAAGARVLKKVGAAVE